jgi:hypothetical protein
MIIDFSRMGEAIADHLAERKVLSMAKGYSANDIYQTSSSCVVRAAQCLIAEGVLPPDQIRFTYEGQPVVHNHLGQLVGIPLDFTAAYETLIVRFKTAVAGRSRDKFTEKQKKELLDLYEGWFKTNMLDTFVEGYEFYYAPDQKGEPRIKDLNRPKLTLIGWGTTEDSMPVAACQVNDQQTVLRAEYLMLAAFDHEGWRCVPEPWDQNEAFRRVGINPDDLKDPTWQVDA